MKAERKALVARARAHIEERERREREQAQEDKIAREKQELRDTLGPAWDDWVAIPVMRRYCGKTPAEFRKGWDRAKDKAKFCDRWGSEAA